MKLWNCGIEKDGILTSQITLFRMTERVDEIATSSNKRMLGSIAITGEGIYLIINCF